MPAALNIIVKKADNVTDITYDLLAASGGDSSPAVYRQDTGAVAALPVGLRANLKLWTQWNGPKTARQMKFTFVYPYATLDTTTGLYTAKDRVLIEGICVVPQSIPANIIGEAVTQGLNALAHGQPKSAGIAGYAPT